MTTIDEATASGVPNTALGSKPMYCTKLREADLAADEIARRQIGEGGIEQEHADQPEQHPAGGAAQTLHDQHHDDGAPMATSSGGRKATASSRRG